ncbi:hypothetical protein PYW07_015568 [Mythimna separata]|uniref:Uncharacterized protein n=1 Tax=Mythimna separata TaxID=271217 RepID=A0AAD7YY37_MYTSE|nr:hypothetical protein PYW07_015568 [Mythimna separata]
MSQSALGLGGERRYSVPSNPLMHDHRGMHSEDLHAWSIYRHSRGHHVAVGARPRRGAPVLRAVQPADARPPRHALRGPARLVHLQSALGLGGERRYSVPSNPLMHDHRGMHSEDLHAWSIYR